MSAVKILTPELLACSCASLVTSTSKARMTANFLRPFSSIVLARMTSFLCTGPMLIPDTGIFTASLFKNSSKASKEPNVDAWTQTPSPAPYYIMCSIVFKYPVQILLQFSGYANHFKKEFRAYFVSQASMNYWECWGKILCEMILGAQCTCAPFRSTSGRHDHGMHTLVLMSQSCHNGGTILRAKDTGWKFLYTVQTCLVKHSYYECHAQRDVHKMCKSVGLTCSVYWCEDISHITHDLSLQIFYTVSLLYHQHLCSCYSWFKILSSYLDTLSSLDILVMQVWASHSQFLQRKGNQWACEQI